MTNTQLSSIFPRNFLGFEPLFREFDHFAKMPNDTYPPHNILQIDEDNLVIEMALAGYTKDDINITQEENTLKISGSKETDTSKYLHKGISTRKFSKSFRLSEHVEVLGADMENGMLKIELKYILPEEKKPRQILIGK